MNKFNQGSHVITETGDRGTINGEESGPNIVYVKLDSTGLTQKWHVDRLKPAPAVPTGMLVVEGEPLTEGKYANRAAAFKKSTEIERLRNAVIEASRAWLSARDSIKARDAAGHDWSNRVSKASAEWVCCVEALERYLNPIAPEAPTPAPLCQPPTEHQGERLHWLRHTDGTTSCWLWSIGAQWFEMGTEEIYEPEEMGANGWAWRSVARPDERVHLTDELLRDLWLDVMGTAKFKRDPHYMISVDLRTFGRKCADLGACDLPPITPTNTTRLQELLLKHHDSLVWVNNNSADGKELTKLLAEHRARAGDV